MTRYTDQQVKEQAQRFENFVSSTNLVKIGKAVLNTILNDEGFFNTHNYVARVLNLANVNHAMYEPTTMMFYGSILKTKALTAYLDNIKK
ncbi:MAG: hypothetical protein ABI091_20825 [Ferruginibacter sp.]